MSEQAEPKIFAVSVRLDGVSEDSAHAHLDLHERLLAASHPGLALVKKEDCLEASVLHGVTLVRKWWFYPPGLEFVPFQPSAST